MEVGPLVRRVKIRYSLDVIHVLHSVPNGTVFPSPILISTHSRSLTGPFQNAPLGAKYG